MYLGTYCETSQTKFYEKNNILLFSKRFFTFQQPKNDYYFYINFSYLAHCLRGYQLRCNRLRDRPLKIHKKKVQHESERLRNPLKMQHEIFHTIRRSAILQNMTNGCGNSGGGVSQSTMINAFSTTGSISCGRICLK